MISCRRNVRIDAKREYLLLPAIRFSPLAVHGRARPSHQSENRTVGSDLCEEKTQKQDAAGEKRHTSSTQRRCDADSEQRLANRVCPRRPRLLRRLPAETSSPLRQLRFPPCPRPRRTTVAHPH